jgi:hypothetical protein
MWISKSNRKGLLDLISSKDPLKIFDIISTKEIERIEDKEQIIFLWRNKPNNINLPVPEIILVQDGQIRDFLAWVSTYISSLQPFTAYCRVLEISTFNKIKDNKQIPLQGVLENAILGAIIGEVITHSINRNIKYITPTAIKSTFSFAMARSISLGYDLKEFKFLFQRWTEARKLSKQHFRSLEFSFIQNVWEVILKLISNQNNTYLMQISNENIINIYEACRELVKNGSIRNNTWRELTKNKIETDHIETRINGPREERVKLFERYIRDLKYQKDINPVVGSFLSGYLAYMISPGEINFTDFLVPVIQKYPDSIVWYCLCASLKKKTQIHDFKNGLGWRILRELGSASNIYDRPECDIALDEFQALMNVDRPKTDFITTNHTHLVLEVIPLLYISLYWPSTKSREQLELFHTDEYEKLQKNTLINLGNTLKNAMKLYDDLIKRTNQFNKGKNRR